MRWLHYLIAILVAAIISCVITIGYHYSYVKPVDGLFIDGIAENAVKIDSLTVKQETDHQQISNAVEFIVAFQGLMNKDTTGYRRLVGNAFGEVVTNFKEAEVRIKTLERRHLELLRAVAVLNKKHWDPAKAAEASGLD